MTKKTWKESWVNVSTVDSSGSQADSKVVVRKNEDGSRRYFLKILRRQDDEERRKRMHREVGAYETLSHPRLPRLVESNSQHFDDSEYKLYLVTEYVEGPNLSEFVLDKGPLVAEQAIALTLAALEVVNYCHDEECVHRDIKPDNIVLRDGNPESPMLVDFGLSFNTSQQLDLSTELDQELGNRFLRLPELQIDSHEQTRSSI